VGTSRRFRLQIGTRLLRDRAPWQPAGMARAAILLCALVGVGCADNPYVIGRIADADRDAGSDAGAGECNGAHAGALLCSGFEASDLVSDWDERVIEGAGALERSTLRAHDGRASLHASTTSMMSVAVLQKTFTPLLSGDVYLRLYLYVPSNLPTQTLNFLFVGDVPTPDPFVGVDFNFEDGAISTFSPQSIPDRQTGTLTIPRDRWFCFRVHVAIGDDDGSVQSFVDDALALETMDIDTLPANGVRQLRAGVDWSSEQDAFFEIYVDDVVLDTAPVGCD
jgi:hypothetical protein